MSPWCGEIHCTTRFIFENGLTLVECKSDFRPVICLWHNSVNHAVGVGTPRNQREARLLPKPIAPSFSMGALQKIHFSKCKRETIVPMTRSFPSLASSTANLLVVAVVCVFHIVRMRSTSRPQPHHQTRKLPSHRSRRHFSWCFPISMLLTFS